MLIFDVVLFYFYVKFYQPGCLQKRICTQISLKLLIYISVCMEQKIFLVNFCKNIRNFFIEKMHVEIHVKIASCLTGFTQKMFCTYILLVRRAPQFVRGFKQNVQGFRHSSYSFGSSRVTTLS